MHHCILILETIEQNKYDHENKLFKENFIKKVKEKLMEKKKKQLIK